MRHEHKPLDALRAAGGHHDHHDDDHHDHHHEHNDHEHHDDHHHDHSHGHSHGVTHRPEERRRLRIAVAITATTMVVEIVGGLWTGSLALISDAGHMFTHAFALGLSLIAIAVAARPTTPERSFGLYRVEVLAALFNAITLAAITFFIAREAWERLMSPQPILAGQMLVVAIFGLLVNVVTAFVLSGAGHDDLNFRSAFLHMVGDTMSSVAIVGGALVIRWTGWVWIDPVLSVLICVVILIWAWGLTRDSVRILLEEAPRDVKTAKVIAGVRGAFEEVADIDDVHVWTITSGMHAMTAYVELARELPLAEQSELAHRLRHFVADEFSIAHAVFQFEPRGDA